MKKLFLFDIDKTLITNTSEKNFAKSINNVHGLGIQSASDYSGLTDKLILALLLESEGWSDEQIEAAMPELLIDLEKSWHETFRTSNIGLILGVKELLAELKRRGHILGLITGNLSSIAKAKLEAVGIYHYFTVGAYGDDPHTSRADLVRLAVKRAGYADKTEDVYVIGDTERDVKAALDAGIQNAVAVSNGFKSVEELENSGALIVFKDFSNVQNVLKALNV